MFQGWEENAQDFGFIGNTRVMITQFESGLGNVCITILVISTYFLGMDHD